MKREPSGPRDDAAAGSAIVLPPARELVAPLEGVHCRLNGIQAAVPALGGSGPLKEALVSPRCGAYSPMNVGLLCLYRERARARACVCPSGQVHVSVHVQRWVNSQQLCWSCKGHEVPSEFV